MVIAEVNVSKTAQCHYSRTVVLRLIIEQRLYVLKLTVSRLIYIKYLAVPGCGVGVCFFRIEIGVGSRVLEFFFFCTSFQVFTRAAEQLGLGVYSLATSGKLTLIVIIPRMAANLHHWICPSLPIVQDSPSRFHQEFQGPRTMNYHESKTVYCVCHGNGSV